MTPEEAKKINSLAREALREEEPALALAEDLKDLREELQTIKETLKKKFDTELSIEIDTEKLRGKKGDTVVGPPGPAGKPGKSVKGKKGEPGTPGIPGKDGSPDSPEQIAEKVNTLTEAVEAKVIKGLPTVEDFVAAIKKNKLLDISDIRNALFGRKSKKIDTSDLRWHGGGISKLTAGANITITELPDGVGYSISATGGAIPFVVDLSDQCDGGTTLFTLPAFTNVLQLTITGWPPNGVLRPTIDFGVVDPTHIQFTSEVSAPESGTTLLALVY